MASLIRVIYALNSNSDLGFSLPWFCRQVPKMEPSIKAPVAGVGLYPYINERRAVVLGLEHVIQNLLVSAGPTRAQHPLCKPHILLGPQPHYVRPPDEETAAHPDQVTLHYLLGCPWSGPQWLHLGVGNRTGIKLWGEFNRKWRRGLVYLGTEQPYVKPCEVTRVEWVFFYCA